VAEGRFRKDLYYRLSGHQIHIPALRERLDDVPLLLHHFLSEAAESQGKPTPTPPKELAGLLAAHHFPGNVRELRAMVFDAVARHRAGVLSLESFKNAIRGNVNPKKIQAITEIEALDLSGRFPTLKEAEALLIREALTRSGGNQSTASSLLGITRQALNKRLNRAQES
jgi:DNA-binding NtrC family response regulator